MGSKTITILKDEHNTTLTVECDDFTISMSIKEFVAMAVLDQARLKRLREQVESLESRQ